MKGFGERISLVDHADKSTIVIFPHRNTLSSGLMGAWLAMWYVIGFTVVWAYFVLELTQKEKVILFVFMTFWVYYALRVTHSFLWMMWGKEKIKLDEVGLHYKRSIKNYGRSQVFYYDNLKDLSFSIPLPGSFQSVWESSPWVNGAERFQFDYFGKMVKFGNKLNDKECQFLSQVLTKRFRLFSKK